VAPLVGEHGTTEMYEDDFAYAAMHQMSLDPRKRAEKGYPF